MRKLTFYISINESLIKEAERITFVKYRNEIEENMQVIEIESIESMIDDLERAVEDLNNQIKDLKQNMSDNYKRIKPEDQL